MTLEPLADTSRRHLRNHAKNYLITHACQDDPAMLQVLCCVQASKAQRRQHVEEAAQPAAKRARRSAAAEQAQPAQELGQPAPTSQDGPEVQAGIP